MVLRWVLAVSSCDPGGAIDGSGIPPGLRCSAGPRLVFSSGAKSPGLGVCEVSHWFVELPSTGPVSGSIVRWESSLGVDVSLQGLSQGNLGWVASNLDPQADLAWISLGSRLDPGTRSSPSQRSCRT